MEMDLGNFGILHLHIGRLHPFLVSETVAFPVLAEFHKGSLLVSTMKSLLRNMP